MGLYLFDLDPVLFIGWILPLSRVRILYSRPSLPELFCPEDVTVGPFNNQASEGFLQADCLTCVRELLSLYTLWFAFQDVVCHLKVMTDVSHYGEISL